MINIQVLCWNWRRNCLAACSVLSSEVRVKEKLQCCLFLHHADAPLSQWHRDSVPEVTGFSNPASQRGCVVGWPCLAARWPPRHFLTPHHQQHRGRKYDEKSCGWDKGREIIYQLLLWAKQPHLLPVNNSAGQWEIKIKPKRPLSPTFPSSQAHLPSWHFWLPRRVVQGEGNGGCDQFTPLCLSYLMLFPFSSVVLSHGLQCFRVRLSQCGLSTGFSCLLDISTCSSMGFSTGNTCSSMVSLMGCRGISAPPPPPLLGELLWPSCPQGCFSCFFPLTPHTVMWCFYPFLNVFSLRCNHLG